MIKVERDEGGWFVRYSSEEPRATVERFVDTRGIVVDWARAFMSSTGSINGRRIEQWRVPVDDPGEAEWAFAVLSLACQRLGIAPPVSADDLDAWAEGAPGRREALGAARAPCRDSDCRPCRAAVTGNYSKPAPTVWTSIEEHAAAVIRDVSDAERLR